MKILLLRPFFSLKKFYFPRPINEPLSLEYLAAFLRKEHLVAILDAMVEDWNQYWELESRPEVIYQGLTLETLVQRIISHQPDLLGISWLFSTQNDCLQMLVKMVKKRCPDLLIVVGGPHPSAQPAQILKDYPEIDLVIFGEGEITLKELVDQKLQALDKIDGLAFRKNGQIIVNQPRALITNLDELSLPARDLLPYHKYAQQTLYVFLYQRLKKIGLSEKRNKFLTSQLSQWPFLDEFYFKCHNWKNKGKKYLPAADLVTSRGCPNHCTFCAIHNVWQHQYRMRSAQNILEEIEFLVSHYGIKHINIQDDNFNVSKSRTIEICQGIIKNKYQITLCANSGAFVPTLDEEVLTWLKRAGLNELRMSIESGNQETLDKIIKKRIDLSLVKPIVQICKKLGIRTEGAFMFGLPGETIQSMKKSLAFAQKTGFDRVIKFIYQPFPHTELYDLCLEKNYLTKDYDPQRIYITGNQCYIRTEEFSPEDVIKIARG